MKAEPCMNVFVGKRNRVAVRTPVQNPTNGAIKYRVDFGEGGAVIVTLPPGGEFFFVVGKHEAQVYMEDFTPNCLFKA